MGYLDNSSITVDAILTKRGRELLARNDGSFNITQFALGDDEIDYTLFNENHPNGSQFSVLRKNPTIILDLDLDSELPSYNGIKGFAIIPNESHKKIKDNFEYYLEKAGIIEKTVKFKAPKKGK